MAIQTASPREQFLKLLDRPRVPAAAQESAGEIIDDKFCLIHFSYASEAGQRIPGILVKPIDSAAARRPVVIVMHGTGENKQKMRPRLMSLAARGMIAVAIDGRYHGERGTIDDYNAAIARAFEQGGAHPLYYDTVWDAMRLIDYLQTRSDIDPKRIGVVGFSKGGIETYFLSAVDQRVAVSAPLIGMQSFRWALDHEAWQARVGTVKKAFTAAAKSAGVEAPDAAFAQRFYDRVIPGCYDKFDGPRMVKLIAPRPLLVVNGDKDKNTPLDGVILCADSATAAYQSAGAADRFKLIIEKDCAHEVRREAWGAVVDWFVQWLGVPAN